MSNTVVIDLATRYASAFGIMAINRQLHTAVVFNDNGNYDFQFYGGADIDIERTVLSHQKQELTFAGMLKDIDGVFAPPLITEFSRDKDLIKTQVNGSDNVIVERWGTKPWQMQIRGILVDMKNKVYPQSQIEDLTQFFEINDIIDVEGIQFEDKRIESLFFEGIKITPVEGFQDTIQFSLTASQIQPVEFNVLKK